MWYPEDKNVLEKTIRELLMQKLEVDVPEKLNGVVVPHAGYQYSGMVAGQGYGLLREYMKDHEIKKAVVVGPSHSTMMKGIACYDEVALKTPLGEITVESEGFDKMGIEQEHSIENQVPFLQHLGFEKIVPLMAGPIRWDEAKETAKKIAEIDGIYVFSTDLSHFLKYDAAVEMDKETIRIIEDMDTSNFDKAEACGIYPMMILIELCKLKGSKPRLIKYMNSGDVIGDKKSVVGYAAMMF
jgi:AmmeMemoRadiSam system protein B